MRKLLMAGLAVLLVVMLAVAAGQIGSIEISVWLALWVVWVIALVKWAIPRDRGPAPVNRRSGDPRIRSKP